MLTNLLVHNIATVKEAIDIFNMGSVISSSAAAAAESLSATDGPPSQTSTGGDAARDVWRHQSSAGAGPRHTTGGASAGAGR